jgi:hypothetical protein
MTLMPSNLALFISSLTEENFPHGWILDHQGPKPSFAPHRFGRLLSKPTMSSRSQDVPAYPKVKLSE